ncbi:unnamed protein product [Schistosoma mattheei]|uniref:Uncharacterized protein n=1 Tax=Schistosoma mattheei TaxID=31246 RepID=A0A183P7B4_9TREM|nr:unnamed protein product [Schistosoma mattheei]
MYNVPIWRMMHIYVHQLSNPRAAYLQLKNTWNSKQMSVNRHKSHNFQYKCQDNSTVWTGKLQNYYNHHPEDTSVFYQLSMQNTSNPLTRHYQQQSTMGENKPDFNEGRNEEEVLEVDRTHIEESTELCVTRQAVIAWNPQGYIKEKRKTKEEHITPRNGDRHEQNEPQLDGTRKEGG